MTIDKIKFYMDKVIFDYWENLANDPSIKLSEKIHYITKAKNTLESEIQAGILTEIKYHAELKYLNMLLN